MKCAFCEEPNLVYTEKRGYQKANSKNSKNSKCGTLVCLFFLYAFSGIQRDIL